jgi:hypothetical protein
LQISGPEAGGNGVSEQVEVWERFFCEFYGAQGGGEGGWPGGGVPGEQRAVRDAFVCAGAAAAEAADAAVRRGAEDQRLDGAGDGAAQQLRRPLAVLHALHCGEWDPRKSPLGAHHSLMSI